MCAHIMSSAHEIIKLNYLNMNGLGGARCLLFSTASTRNNPRTNQKSNDNHQTLNSNSREKFSRMNNEHEVRLLQKVSDLMVKHPTE